MGPDVDNSKKMLDANFTTDITAVHRPLKLMLIFIMSVGQRPMKSLLPVCPSVIKFSQDWMISFL